MSMTGSNPDTTTSNTVFKRSLLAICVAAASNAAFAEEEIPSHEALEEVVVQGVRGSLMNAQDMKRDASTVADAISASDINALPDKSVLEALQRVPGVSIERFAAAEDPDHFSIEGSGATLRGMVQSRSEFNGRDSFSANNGSGLNFQDVPPELMGAVIVYKNQTADMIEGGIAGTINLETRKPFDSDGQTIAFNTAVNYTDMREAATPDFSGLYSNTWSTEAGEFGFLISAANSKLEVSNNSIQQGVPELKAISGVGERWVPINVGARLVDQDRERTGGSMVFQWADNDGSKLFTAEYVRSDADQSWLEHAFQSDNTVGEPSADSTYNDLRFISGTLEGATGYNSYTRQSHSHTLVEDFSLNLELNPTDRLQVTLDAQYVDASTKVVDLSVFGHTAADVYANFGGGTPDVAFLAPSSSSQTSEEYFTDPANYFYLAEMDHIEDNDGKEAAYTLDVEYQLDKGWFRSVKSGLRASQREQTTRWSTYQWGVVSADWAGGQKFFNGVHDVDPWDGLPGTATYPAPEYGTANFNDFFRGKTTGITGGTLLVPSPDLVQNFSRYREQLGEISPDFFTSIADRDGVTNGPFVPDEINPITEDRFAGYVMAEFANADDTLTGNFGLRYVDLSYETTGGSSFAYLDDRLPLPADDLAFFNGETTSFVDNVSDQHFLPSFNLKYELQEDLLVRFGASQAIAFPDMGMLRSYLGVYAIIEGVDTDGDEVEDTGVVTDYRAGTGNSRLKPMQANNFDLALEWYFSDVGAVSGTLFHKDISDFFTSGTFPREITNNGVTRTVQVEGPVNFGDGKVTGLELAYQQFFDTLPGAWSGLGLQANYTYVDNKSIPNQNLDSQEGGNVEVAFDSLPLAGMSEHTYNLVGLYEYEDISARLAWNWRSEYLLTTRDVITKLPIYNGEGGQLDGSIFYNVNDNMKVGLEATNILDQITKTSMQVNEEGQKLDRSWFINDRRIAAVVRINF
ncbi:TonB-dependent receptor [Microbulbifer agarilyticus]|uniref:TonB-dependent receptor n=1 Tax=Microbulbifer agarilyticus TaxID=260552 RepID=UPI001CD617DE|nr:TonB-dependent receptor [Microbulbifer agarilyticus]MCA0899166.1 TonB-dependent receptor [Microbulbifer agarilyticus]